MRIVLDTNVFVSYLFSRKNSPIYQIWQLWQKGEIIICYTPKTLTELTRVLLSEKINRLTDYSVDEIKQYLRIIARHGLKFNINKIPKIIKNCLSVDKRKEFIYGLMDYNSKEPFFITDLERFFDYKNPQQDIRKIVKEFINIGVFIKIDKIKGDYRYKINKKLLEKLIRNTDYFIFIEKFIHKSNSMAIT